MRKYLITIICVFAVARCAFGQVDEYSGKYLRYYCPEHCRDNPCSCITQRSCTPQRVTSSKWDTHTIDFRSGCQAIKWCSYDGSLCYSEMADDDIATPTQNNPSTNGGPTLWSEDTQGSPMTADSSDDLCDNPDYECIPNGIGGSANSCSHQDEDCLACNRAGACVITRGQQTREFCHKCETQRGGKCVHGQWASCAIRRSRLSQSIGIKI